MDKVLRNEFNERVSHYRQTLVSCARKSEWDVFKVCAGRLFDYLESVEMTEIENKFFKIFKVIMIGLFFLVVFIFRMNFDVRPEILKIRELAILVAIACSCYELYFFMNFRMYLEYKTTFYKKRRERFIVDIERDFKDI